MNPMLTIVRQVPSRHGEERFCILHEVPTPSLKAFAFTCVGGACGLNGVPAGIACDLLMAAGISEAEAYRMLEEARAARRKVLPL